jgi:hypothetical protein
LQNKLEVEGQLELANHDDRRIIASQRKQIAASDFTFDNEAEPFEDDAEIHRLNGKVALATGGLTGQGLGSTGWAKPVRRRRSERCLGREFAYRSLRDLAEVDEPALQVALERLAEADILFVEGAGPQAVYRFKHALVQEAAYQTLLRSRRQQLHSKIAQALETRFPETAISRPELLAMHYAEAGQPERSISYRLKAAQLTASRFANAEAITHATRGLTELRSFPQSEHRHQLELQFLTALGPALVATRGYAADETIEAYQRARELVNESRDEKNWDVVLTGLYVAYYNRAAYRAGLGCRPRVPETGRERGQPMRRASHARRFLQHYGPLRRIRGGGRSGLFVLRPRRPFRPRMAVRP